MQDFCQVTRYIRISSNPTGGILIKFFFPRSLFGDVFFHVCFLLFFCVLFVCLDFICMFFFCCIVFF